MSSRTAIASVFVMGSLLIWSGLAWSQKSDANTNCADKERVQYLRSGAFVDNDTTRVKCTVSYWICGHAFSKSQVVKQGPNACDSFYGSVLNDLPKETCCDCYPNCLDQQKQDCCGDVQALKDQVKQLEERVRQLEDKLSGDEITLGSGPSNLTISNRPGSEGVTINSGGNITINAGGKSVSITSGGDVSIKATGNLNLKGSKITQN